MKLFAALCMLALFGCLLQTTPVGKITAVPESYSGQQVAVKGTIEDSVKIGRLSGFSLSDGTGTINVKSDTLPPVGTEATVKGTVVKDSLFGYYILASEVDWKK
ncbi:MAG: hypothetical protein U0R44_02425 [Candidatus Micrarchaeia archaeon]